MKRFKEVINFLEKILFKVNEKASVFLVVIALIAMFYNIDLNALVYLGCGWLFYSFLAFFATLKYAKIQNEKALEHIETWVLYTEEYLIFLVIYSIRMVNSFFQNLITSKLFAPLLLLVVYLITEKAMKFIKKEEGEIIEVGTEEGKSEE